MAVLCGTLWKKASIPASERLYSVAMKYKHFRNSLQLLSGQNNEEKKADFFLIEEFCTFFIEALGIILCVSSVHQKRREKL